MGSHRLALLASLFVCAGCAHHEPVPLDPVAERDVVAARLNTTTETPSRPRLPEHLFPIAAVVTVEQGLSLAEANAIALRFAPPLVAARRAFGIRGAELLRAGLLENPEVFFGPRFTGNGGLILPGSLSLEIPLGGKLAAEERLAGAEVEAARARLLDAEATLLVDVRRRFILIAAMDRRIAILRRTVATSTAVTDRTERLLQGGEVDRVAVGLAALERDEARLELVKAEADSQEARFGLLAAIGLLPDPDVVIAADGAMLDRLRLPPPEPDTLLRHSGLRALEASYRAAEHGLDLEFARQYPTVRIGPEFESDEGATSIGFGLSFTLPIFDSNVGGIAVANERRAAAREAWHAALLELARREAVARARHARAAASLNELRASTVPAADSAERALEARRRGGQASLIEGLAARSAIARARLREVDLERETSLRALEVLWASGRLFPIDDEPKAPTDGDDS